MEFSQCCYEPIRRGKCSLCKVKAVPLEILEYCTHNDFCQECSHANVYGYGTSHSEAPSDLTDIECGIVDDKDFEDKCPGFTHLKGE